MQEHLAIDTVVPTASSHCVDANNIDQLIDVVSNVFCPMECHSLASHLDAKLTVVQLDKIVFATVSSQPIKVIRNRHHIAQATDNFYLLKFQLSGTSTVQHRHQEAVLNAGDFIICSSSDPYELHFPQPYKQAVLTIAQSQLNDLVCNPGQHLGRTMQGSDPVNGMLSEFVYFKRRANLSQVPSQSIIKFPSCKDVHDEHCFTVG